MTISNKMFLLATHIPSTGASTAKEKGFEGPAQKRRNQGTLDERIWLGIDWSLLVFGNDLERW